MTRGSKPTFVMQVRCGVFKIVHGTQMINREFTNRSEADSLVSQLRKERITVKQIEEKK